MGEARPTFELLEDDVERAFEVLVLLTRLGQAQKGEQTRHVAVRLWAMKHQVGDECDVQKPLGLFPEGIAGVLAVA